VIVSQLQASMLRFHNRMVVVLGSTDFERIQRQVRWHYQWVVLHDFLPRSSVWTPCAIFSALPRTEELTTRAVYPEILQTKERSVHARGVFRRRYRSGIR